MRGVAEPQIGEKLPERESARHAGSAQLARNAEHYHGLRRFSQVSTVAVAGKRQQRSRHRRQFHRVGPVGLRSLRPHQEILRAHDAACLLPDTPKTIFRPSIVLGDSRHAETTQFDMVRAFVFLAGLPVLPFRPNDRIDIVNVDFVADAIATLHQKEKPQFDTYHLSSGRVFADFPRVDSALAAAQEKREPIFLPFAEKPFAGAVNILANRKGSLGLRRRIDESLHAISGMEHGVR